MQPKICNFKFSREFNAATIQIDDMNDIIHWLAPEKLNHISTEKDSKKSNKKQEEASYTIQFDIFRLVNYFDTMIFFKKKLNFLLSILVLLCFFGNLVFKRNLMKMFL